MNDSGLNLLFPVLLFDGAFCEYIQERSFIPIPSSENADGDFIFEVWDSSHVIWQLSFVPKIGSPYRQCQWKLMRKYELSELKRRVEYCISHDDDILTQFVDGGLITELIHDRDSMTQVCYVLNLLAFDFDEEKARELLDVEGDRKKS